MERQLMRKLRRLGLECLRVAGSSGPDILTSINGRFIFFECKYTSKDRVYVPREEIVREERIARKMGAELRLAVKFGRDEWVMLRASELEPFGREKSFLITREDAARLPKVTSILDRNLKDYD